MCDCEIEYIDKVGQIKRFFVLLNNALDSFDDFYRATLYVSAV